MAKIGSDVKETIINRPYAIQLKMWDCLTVEDRRQAARPKATELAQIGRVFGEDFAAGPIRRSRIAYLTDEEKKEDRFSTRGSSKFFFLGNGYSKIVFTPRCDSNLVYKFSPGDYCTKGQQPRDDSQNILEIAMWQALQSDGIAGKNRDYMHFAYMYAAFKKLGLIVAEKSPIVDSLWQCMKECNARNQEIVNVQNSDSSNMFLTVVPQNYDEKWFDTILNPILWKYDLRDVKHNSGNCGIRCNPDGFFSPIVLDYGLKSDM